MCLSPERFVLIIEFNVAEFNVLGADL